MLWLGGSGDWGGAQGGETEVRLEGWRVEGGFVCDAVSPSQEGTRPKFPPHSAPGCSRKCSTFNTNMLKNSAASQKYD